MITVGDIRRQFDTNAAETGCEVVFYDLDEWAGPTFDPPVEMGPWIPRGWTPPTLVAFRGFVAHVCPAVIRTAMELAGLDPHEIADYLTNVRIVMNVHQSNYTMALDDRTRLAETTLHALNPEALALLSRVDLAVVDAVS